MVLKLIKRVQGEIAKITYLRELPEQIQLDPVTDRKDNSIICWVINWGIASLNDSFKYYFKTVEEGSKVLDYLYNYRSNIADLEVLIKSSGVKTWN